MNPVSKRRAAQLREYAKASKAWLDGRECERCLDGTVATQVHHRIGRSGWRLLDQRHWSGLCLTCHRWVTDNGREARWQGYSGDRLATA